MADDDEREAAYFARITAKKTGATARPAHTTAVATKTQPNLENATLRTKTFAKEDARIEGAEEARLNRLLNKGVQVPNFQKSNDPYEEAPAVSLSLPGPPSQTKSAHGAEESTSVTLAFPGPPNQKSEGTKAGHKAPQQVVVTQAPPANKSRDPSPRPKPRSSREPSPRSKTVREPSPREKKSSAELSPREKKSSAETSPREKKSSREPSPRSNSTKAKRSSGDAAAVAAPQRKISTDRERKTSGGRGNSSGNASSNGGSGFAARQAMFEQGAAKQETTPAPAKSAFANRQAMFEQAAHQSEQTAPVIKKKTPVVAAVEQHTASVAKSSHPSLPTTTPVTNKAAANKAYNTMPASNAVGTAGAKPRTPAGARKLPDWQQVPSQVQTNTKYENTLLAEILSVRANPQSLIPALKSRILGFVGKNYLDPISNCFMQTLEGEAAVVEAIAFLQSQPAVGGTLKLEEGLSLSARDFCALNEGNVEITESNEQATARLTKYGDFSGELFQNICYNNLPPEDMIQTWIIDDGNTGNRVNREALFNPEVSCIGIASGPTGLTERVVCLLLAGGYEFGAVSDTDTSIRVFSGQKQHHAADAESARPAGSAHQAAKPGWNTITGVASGSHHNSAHPPAAASPAGPSKWQQQQQAKKEQQEQQQAHNNAKPGWNTLKTAAAGSPPTTATLPVKKYPAYAVGGLQQCDGGTATELTISNLGCGVEDLTLELRENGKALAFSRVVSSEGRLMGLPYQVTSTSLTATYNPTVGGGSLRLRFGKPTVPDFDVCTFHVTGQPGSTADRAVMQVISTNPACFEFTPGPSMSIDTTFHVKMSGTTLLFKTEPQNSTQTVNLPLPITKNQVECVDLGPGKGSAIKIWHQKPADLNIDQPTCSIPINIA